MTPPRFWCGKLLAFLSFAAWTGAVAAKETPSLESFFASTTAKISTTSNAVNVPVEWTYNNPTNLPLVVEKFDGTCGCLAGKIDQTISETNKSGAIRATFTPGGYRGIVRKSLHVRFVGYEKPIELIVEANIPSSVEISNREPFWQLGKEAKTQSIDITTGTGEDFTIKSLQGVPESLFNISQETITPKRHYRLHITPVSVETPDLQTLQIHTDSKDSRDQLLGVFLRISKTDPTSRTPSKP